MLDDSSVEISVDDDHISNSVEPVSVEPELLTQM